MVTRPSFRTLRHASRADGSVARIPPGGDAQRLVQRLRSFRGIDRDRQYRARRQLRREIRLRLRLRQFAVETAAQHRRERIACLAFRPRGQLDLVGMAEIERQLRRGRITPDRLDLQAPQHHFLQPGRIVRLELARRIRVAPQPPPHAAQGLALAERPLACGEEVQQHAERKQVAARIVAHAEQPLGRHVGRGAVGQPEFFLQQVGQLIVMRQSEIDQHGLARGAKHDAARLDVVMDDVLPVQVGQRGGDLADDGPRLFIGDRQIGQALVERLARNALDHDIGLPREIAGPEAGRHVRPRQPRQDHLLHLETDDGGGILSLGYPRHLHQHRRVDAGPASRSTASPCRRYGRTPRS